jgi:N-acetylglutamate synthase-like GNAT family acetyltransferase
MSVVVRTADLKDIKAIAALSTQLGYPSTAGQVRPRLENISKDEDHVLFIAEMSRGLVVGFVHVYVGVQVVSDSEATIGELVVDKDHRTRGIGRRLVQRAEEWARKKECSALRVNSNVVRNEAKVFYEGLGFEHLKTQRVFYKSWSRCRPRSPSTPRPKM